MAAVANANSVFEVNDTTDKVYHQPSHTSLWSLLRGNTRTQGKGLKAAFVHVTWTATDTYATGGVQLNLLANLPGWSYILMTVTNPVWNSTTTAAWEQGNFVDQNNATATSRLLIFNVLAPAAETIASEIANGRALASAGIEVLVLGY